MSSKDQTIALPYELRDSVDTGAMGSCTLIPFDTATVVRGFVNDTYFLIVSGNAPCLGMAIQLVPLIYIQKPQYWGIQVIGCLKGACAEAITPYTIWLEITNFIGHKGIEVIGSNEPEEIQVP